MGRNIKTNKILRNKLKEAKDLYTANYKALLKEISEDYDKWKEVLCSQIGQLDIVKMPVLPKAI